MRDFPRLAAAALTLAVCAATGGAKDLHKDIGGLRAAHREGEDFCVEWLDRKSTTAVFAIHGGTIEPGTSEAARAVAGPDWSFYLFEGLKASSRRPHELHLTSKRFQDAPAVALATAAVLAVSLHGAFDTDEKICIGGTNAARCASTARALAAAGFQTEEPCRRLPGASRRNIANRAGEGGVQLELSEGLRARFRTEPALLQRFAAAVREGLRSP
ncbi:MAG: poly-gamma-glutamate hydrolase family protein [Elusimicrobiota bacterium]